MSITQSDVVPKAYFVTSGSQLRRINAVETKVDSTPKCNPSVHAASCNVSAKNTV